MRRGLLRNRSRAATCTIEMWRHSHTGRPAWSACTCWSLADAHEHTGQNSCRDRAKGPRPTSTKSAAERRSAVASAFIRLKCRRLPQADHVEPLLVLQPPAESHLSKPRRPHPRRRPRAAVDRGGCRYSLSAARRPVRGCVHEDAERGTVQLRKPFFDTREFSLDVVLGRDCTQAQT